MKNNTISNLMLERYLLNELPSEKMNEISNTALIDAELRNRIEDLKNSTQEINERYSFLIFKARLENAKKSENKPFELNAALKIKFPDFNWKKFLIPAASFCILLAAVTVFINPFKFNSNSDITTIKGDSSKLFIYRLDGDSISLLKNKDKCHTGNLLQISYQISEDNFGIILSIDGTGNITQHFPKEGTSSTKIDSHEKITLGESYELDNAPKFERFILISGKTEIDINTVTNQIRKYFVNEGIFFNDRIPLDSSFNQSSVLILKE